MDEVLTIAEIEARFPDSWILLDQPVVENGRTVRGRVVAVGPDRDEVWKKALDLPIPRYVASYCTKKRKPDTAYIL
jgi:hypothetical protein